MDEAQLTHALEALSDPQVARAAGKQITTLRGVRGVPLAALARLGAQAWRGGVDLDEEATALDRLFGVAWEDGLLAIGLAAAGVPDAPWAAWELATTWLDRVDDTHTADALGWLLLGPALLALGKPIDALTCHRTHAHPTARRAVVCAGLAMLPVPIEGPAAAPLRERLGERHVQLVAAPLTPAIAALADAFVRDEAPEVRKALRRLVREWTDADAAGVVAWADGVRGGLPRLIGDEVKRARRRVGAP